MIGMKKKIITTNRDIVNYDIYDPQNILVISREDVNIPTLFFKSAYKELNEQIYKKYHIKSWIKDIFQ